MTNLTRNYFFCMFISISYMFRAISCLSSGESLASIQHLVCVTYTEWQLPDAALIHLIFLMISTRLLETLQEPKCTSLTESRISWCWRNWFINCLLSICKRLSYRRVHTDMQRERPWKKIYECKISVGQRPLQRWTCSAPACCMGNLGVHVSHQKSHFIKYVSVTSLEFQEVKFPRFYDNGTGRW
jgi:hypothetical protein